ncbi:MAG: hypothetical protein RSB81_02505 [Anaerovoracaceae bacterium]
MAEWIAIGISVLCMIGSLVSFVLAQKEKKNAKSSEEQAKHYAEVASAADISAKNYYDLLVSEEKPKQLKYQIIRHLKLKTNKRTTKDVSEALNISEDEAHDILLDMLWVDDMLTATGNTETINNETTWNPKR